MRQRRAGGDLQLPPAQADHAAHSGEQHHPRHGVQDRHRPPEDPPGADSQDAAHPHLRRRGGHGRADPGPDERTAAKKRPDRRLPGRPGQGGHRPAQCEQPYPAAVWGGVRAAGILHAGGGDRRGDPAAGHHQ